MTTRPVQPGDIGFQRSHRPMGLAVLAGEALRFRRAQFSHVFAIDRVVDGLAYVVSAEMSGVSDSLTLVELEARGPVTIVPPPAGVNVEEFLTFLRAQVGDEYGLMTDVAMAIDIMSWSWVPSFRGARKGSWQCAALICEGLRFGGWLHNWISVYDIFPDQAYDAITKEQP